MSAAWGFTHYFLVATDESRRQYAFPGHDLRRGHSRIAAAVRLDPELANPRGCLVGLRASGAGELGRAVRHVRLGIPGDLDRSRQRAAVPELRGHLDRRARVRRATAAADVHRRRAGGVAHRRPSAELRRRSRLPLPARLRHHHDLYLAHRLRVLARPQRAAGLALARDPHAVRARLAVPAAHAAVRHAAVGADRSGVRERVAYGAELRGAAVHHRDRLHPARDGQGADRISGIGPPPWSIR